MSSFRIFRVDATYTEAYKQERNMTHAVGTSWACQSLGEAVKIKAAISSDPGFESVEIVTSTYGG